MPVRVAVLDDYQEVARHYGPFDTLGDDVEVTVFHDHILIDGVVRDLLGEFDVIVAMRERTPFTAKRLASLPNLKLLVTTGMGNAAIDMDAARDAGRRRLRDGRAGQPDRRARVGADHRPDAAHPGRGPADPRRRLAAHDRAGAGRPHARHRRARPASGRGWRRSAGRSRWT